MLSRVHDQHLNKETFYKIAISGVGSGMGDGQSLDLTSIPYLNIEKWFGGTSKDGKVVVLHSVY